MRLQLEPLADEDVGTFVLRNHIENVSYKLHAELDVSGEVVLFIVKDEKSNAEEQDQREEKVDVVDKNVVTQENSCGESPSKRQRLSDTSSGGKGCRSFKKRCFLKPPFGPSKRCLVNLYVFTSRNSGIPFNNVSGTETIKALKARICKDEHLDPSKYKLFYDGKELSNDTVISDLRKKEKGGIIDIELRRDNLFVKLPTGKNVALHSCMIKPNDFIFMIKQHIQKLERIPFHQQTLYFKGKKLCDTDTLAICGIEDGSVLSLEYLSATTFTINVKTSTGNRLKLTDLCPESTIKDLKIAISKADGTPFNNQRLVFQNRRLENDLTLRHYKIETGSTVYLVLRHRGDIFDIGSGQNEGFSLVKSQALSSPTLCLFLVNVYLMPYNHKVCIEINGSVLVKELYWRIKQYHAGFKRTSSQLQQNMSLASNEEKMAIEYHEKPYGSTERYSVGQCEEKPAAEPTCILQGEPSENPVRWNFDRVAAWLDEIHLSSYKKLFYDNEVRCLFKFLFENEICGVKPQKFK